MTGAVATSPAPLLRIEDLTVTFDNGSGPRLAAVDGLSLSVFAGQTLAVVGESGCGKSVTAMSIPRLIPTPPGRYDSGRVELRRNGAVRDLLALDARSLRQVRGGEVAMIFQEPMSSLNPVYTIGDQLVEAIVLHQGVGGRRARGVAVKAMERVGIANAGDRLRDYPHQFSGGMRQRVMIAMALACEPSLLIADEPTTALDVTIAAHILDLLQDLRRATGMGMILITHDLGVVARRADTVCVMYAGRAVEYARTAALFEKPLHPYTRGLLAGIPRIGDRRERLTTIRDVTSDESNFDVCAGRAWWPWHDIPPSVVLDDEEHDSRLVLAEPGHWIRLWRTREAVAMDAPEPLLGPTHTPHASVQ